MIDKLIALLAHTRRTAGERGASGFVGKDAPSLNVVAATRRAVVSPSTFVCADLLHAVVRRKDAQQRALTEREHAVLLLLAEGLGSAAIGDRLYLSESMAKSYVARIYSKLGAANRAQALVTAMRAGLLSSVSSARR